MPYTNIPEDLWDEMDSCVEKVQAQGHDKDSAIAICHASIVEGKAADPEGLIGLLPEGMTTTIHEAMGLKVTGTTEESEVLDSIVGMIPIDVMHPGSPSIPALLAAHGTATLAFWRSFIEGITQPVQVSSKSILDASTGHRTIVPLRAGDIVPPLEEQFSAARAFNKGLPSSIKYCVFLLPSTGAGHATKATLSLHEASGERHTALFADLRDKGWHEIILDKGQFHFKPKSAWSQAFINDLDDDCFLYIEPGGEKDEGGKTTPRSLRHFPYKGSDGAVDLPHLRNAIARIPQSNAPGLDEDKKASLQKRAQGILADETAKEQKGSDPLSFTDHFMAELQHQKKAD